MSELTPEERQRIYEEETYRAKVRAEMEREAQAKMPQKPEQIGCGASCLLLIVIVPLFVMLMSTLTGGCGNSSPTYSYSPSSGSNSYTSPAPLYKTPSSPSTSASPRTSRTFFESAKNATPLLQEATEQLARLFEGVDETRMHSPEWKRQVKEATQKIESFCNTIDQIPRPDEYQIIYDDLQEVSKTFRTAATDIGTALETGTTTDWELATLSVLTAQAKLSQASALLKQLREAVENSSH